MIKCYTRVVSRVLLAALVIILLSNMATASEKSNDRWIFFEPVNKTELEAMGYEVIHELDNALVVKDTGIVRAKSQDTLQKFNAVPDKRYNITGINSDKQINANELWSSGFTGSGITVAVLDTGIDYTHVQLNDSYAGGKDWVNNDNDPMDDHGHGTHVSGIITANSGDVKGTAPDASIWAGKVCDENGVCWGGDVAAAIEYVVKNDVAPIISISLGSKGTTEEDCDENYLASKANWAVRNGVTVVAAAGNNPNYVCSPGCGSDVIAVGAVDDYDKRASFSGVGKSLDIMAPGVSIQSTVIQGSESWSGTSMAAPHVSGTIALLLEKDRSLKVSGIKDALYSTSIDLGSNGWDEHYGWGRLNSAEAFRYIFSSDDRLCGDVNQDNKVNLGDVVLLYNNVRNPEEYDVPKWEADVNCDGKINLGDVIQLWNYHKNSSKYTLLCCEK